MDHELSKILQLPLQYYSCLAICTHVYYDNHRDMISCLRAEYGDMVTVSGPVLKVCPRPISGRWGRASSCECYWLGFDDREQGLHFEQIANVFSKVVGERAYYKEHLKREADAEAAANAPAEPVVPPDGGRGGARGRGRGRGEARGRGRGRGRSKRLASEDDDSFKVKFGRWSAKA